MGADPKQKDRIGSSRATSEMSKKYRMITNRYEDSIVIYFKDSDFDHVDSCSSHLDRKKIYELAFIPINHYLIKLIAYLMKG